MSNDIDFAARKALLEKKLSEESKPETEEIESPPPLNDNPYADYPAAGEYYEPVKKYDMPAAPKNTDKNLLKMASGTIIAFALIDLLLLIWAYLTAVPTLIMVDRNLDTNFMTALSQSALFGIFLIIFMLVVGFLGIANFDNPQGAKKCVVLGLIILLPSAVSLLGAIDSGGFLDIIFGILTVALPAAYTWGAYQAVKGIR
jgi:hypothetical protein